MAVNLNDVGIQSYSGSTLVDKVEYEQKVDDVFIPDNDSSFGDAEAFDPMVDFSIKGHGDLPALLILGAGTGIGTSGGAAAAITGINDGAGTRIITNVKESERNDNFNSWECSGSYWPGAV